MIRAKRLSHPKPDSAKVRSALLIAYAVVLSIGAAMTGLVTIGTQPEPVKYRILAFGVGRIAATEIECIALPKACIVQFEQAVPNGQPQADPLPFMEVGRSGLIAIVCSTGPVEVAFSSAVEWWAPGKSPSSSATVSSSRPWVNVDASVPTEYEAVNNYPSRYPGQLPGETCIVDEVDIMEQTPIGGTAVSGFSNFAPEDESVLYAGERFGQAADSDVVLARIVVSYEVEDGADGKAITAPFYAGARGKFDRTIESTRVWGHMDVHSSAAPVAIRTTSLVSIWGSALGALLAVTAITVGVALPALKAARRAEHLAEVEQVANGRFEQIISATHHELNREIALVGLGIMAVEDSDPDGPEELNEAYARLEEGSANVAALAKLGRELHTNEDETVTAEHLVPITDEMKVTATTIEPLTGDRLLLKTLTKNAARNSETHGDASEMHIITDGSTLTIVDDGAGADADTLAKAWVGGLRPNGTAGEGLSIIQRVIEAHRAKGTIEVNENGGVTIVVDFGP